MDNRAKQEDLEQDIDELLDETPTEDTQEETVEDVDQVDETLEDEEKDVGSDDEQPTPSEEAPKEPDYREKFKASTQEAQILNSKNSKFTDAVEQAAQLNEVSETDLRAKYADWDQMSDPQKALAKDNLLAAMRFEMVHNAVLETKKGDEWATKVDDFLTDDTQIAPYPGLAGREMEFKSFAQKPSRVGVDMGVLASAFLYESPSPTKKHKGSLLLNGGNSEPHDTKPKKLGADEAALIRAKSPRQYMEMVRNGQIGSDDDI